MNIQFRYANFDEYPRVSQFLDQHWAKNHVYVRERRLFDWTFRRDGHLESEAYSFVIAENGNEIVAILGGIPFTFNCLGKTSKAVWIVNYAVRPDHRRGPVALQLLSTFRRPPFGEVIASGLNPDSTIIYKVLRGTILPELPRHLGIFADATDRMVNLLQLTYPEWNKKRAEDVANNFILPSGANQDVQHGTTIPNTWDHTDWPAIATETVGAVRNSEYLRWRYLDHPSFEYHTVTVCEGDRSGLAVWRLETIHRQAPEGRIPVDTLARLVEFLPASNENGHLLIQTLLKDVRAAGAMGIDFYGYHGSARTILEQSGVRSVAAHPDGALIPYRFQPLDTHGGGILNAMFAPEGLPPCTTGLECLWYWTKSDSDQDRPN
jgi:hypothetical protein